MSALDDFINILKSKDYEYSVSKSFLGVFDDEGNTQLIVFIDVPKRLETHKEIILTERFNDAWQELEMCEELCSLS